MFKTKNLLPINMNFMFKYCRISLFAPLVHHSCIFMITFTSLTPTCMYFSTRFAWKSSGNNLKLKLSDRSVLKLNLEEHHIWFSFSLLVTRLINTMPFPFLFAFYFRYHPYTPTCTVQCTCKVVWWESSACKPNTYSLHVEQLQLNLSGYTI